MEPAGNAGGHNQKGGEIASVQRVLRVGPGSGVENALDAPGEGGVHRGAEIERRASGNPFAIRHAGPLLNQELRTA